MPAFGWCVIRERVDGPVRHVLVVRQDIELAEHTGLLQVAVRDGSVRVVLRD